MVGGAVFTWVLRAHPGLLRPAHDPTFTDMNKQAGVWLMVAGLLAAGLLAGCASGPRPQRGGVAEGLGGMRVQQPENPAGPARQEHWRSNVVEYGVVPGLRWEGEVPVVTRTVLVEQTQQVVGEAQRDTARELAARAASLRPVQVLGGVLLLGALAMFHPVVGRLVGSRTTQAMTGVVGMMLLFAPAVVPGHERLLIVAGLLGVAVWWMAHRHGELRGKVQEG